MARTRVAVVVHHGLHRADYAQSSVKMARRMIKDEKAIAATKLVTIPAPVAFLSIFCRPFFVLRERENAVGELCESHFLGVKG